MSEREIEEAQREAILQARALDRICTPDDENEPPDFKTEDDFGA